MRELFAAVDDEFRREAEYAEEWRLAGEVIREREIKREAAREAKREAAVRVQEARKDSIASAAHCAIDTVSQHEMSLKELAALKDSINSAALTEIGIPEKAVDCRVCDDALASEMLKREKEGGRQP